MLHLKRMLHHSVNPNKILPRKLTTSLIMVFLVLLMTTPFVFADTAEKAPVTKAVKCPGTVRVLVEPVNPASFDEYAALESLTQPVREYDIVNKTAGNILKIEQAVGNQIKAGDVILVLDTTKLNENLSAAREELKKAQRVLFARQHWKVRSPRAEEVAAAKVSEWETAVKNLEEQINSATVTAPGDGVIVSLGVSEGDHISDDFLLGKIQDLTAIRIPLSDHAAAVEDGQLIPVTIEGIDNPMEATVKKDERGSAILIIANDEGKIAVEKKAAFRVMIKNHPQAIVVSKDVIVADETGSYVFIVNGKRAKKVQVNVAAETDGQCMISSGLAAADTLIVAEILSQKEGTVREAFTCLQDNKKIKPLQKGELSGKLVKVKPVAKVEDKPAEPQEPVKVKVKKEKVVKEAGETPEYSRFRIGAGGAFFGMFDYDDFGFHNVYGNLFGFSADLSYRFSKSMDVWATAAFSSKESSLQEIEEWFGEPTKFTLTALALDLRYYIIQGKLLDLIAGAGISFYPFKDENTIENVSETAIGFNGLVGTYIHLAKHFDLHLILRLHSVKKTLDNADYNLKMDNGELLFGISYSF